MALVKFFGMVSPWKMRKWRRGGERPPKYDLAWTPVTDPSDHHTATLTFTAAANYLGRVTKNIHLAQVMAFQVECYPDGTMPTVLARLAEPKNGPWLARIMIPGQTTLHSAWETEEQAKGHCQAFYDAAIMGNQDDLFVDPALLRRR